MRRAAALATLKVALFTDTLDEINVGYDDLHAGTNIRGVIRFD